MKKYTLKLFLFLFPFLGFVAFVNIYTDPGEVFSNHNQQAAILMLKGSNVLKTAVPNDWKDLHLSYLQQRQKMKLPKLPIAVWGSSRSSEISKEMIGNKNFHNFALPGSSILDHVAMISMFEEMNALPDTIILNIDPWMFYQRKSLMKEGEVYYVNDEGKKLQCKKGMLPYFLTSIDKFKIKKEPFMLSPEEKIPWSTKIMTAFSPSYFQSSLKTLSKSNNSPTRANFIRGQFILRSDGSYSLGEFTPSKIPKIELISRNYATLHKRNALFSESSLRSDYFELLNHFSLYLKNKGVTLYFFMTPVHPLMYPSSEMQHTTVMEKEIKELASQSGIPTIGSFNPYNYPALVSHKYFVADGLHLSKEGILLLLSGNWRSGSPAF